MKTLQLINQEETVFSFKYGDCSKRGGIKSKLVMGWQSPRSNKKTNLHTAFYSRTDLRTKGFIKNTFIAMFFQITTCSRNCVDLAKSGLGIRKDVRIIKKSTIHLLISTIQSLFSIDE